MNRERSNRRAPARRLPLAERLFGPRAQFVAAAGVLAAAFLLGGGARDDITSLVLLRPLAIFAMGYALYRPGPNWRAHLGPVFWLLLALLAWALMELIPLPHGLWSSLPGRALIAANDVAAGVGEIARPISLAPHKTLNAAFALTVPLAVLLTLANLDGPRARQLLWVVYAALLLNVVVAVLQLLGPPGGALYFYRITNAANPVGLFSNRNHMAIFFASAMPLLAHVALAGGEARERRPLAVAASAGGILVLLMLVLAAGSRAGLVLSAVSLAACAGLWLLHQRERLARRRKGWTLPLIGAGGVAALVAIGVLAGSRSATIDRLFAESLGEDLRVQILPQLWDMLYAYFPVGAGIGAFEFAYQVFEPSALLRTTYLNHAHNDLLEFVIDGGAVALLLLAGAAWWLLRGGIAAARTALSQRAHERPDMLPFAWLALAVLLAGSFGDYPLRTPAIMAYAALLCGLIHRRLAGDRAA